MTDTPRTDAFMEELRRPGYGEAMPRYWDFTRQLERELRESQAEVERLRSQIETMLKHDAEALESDSIVGSCNCLTKTPEVIHHKPGCKYRLLEERGCSPTRSRRW